MRNIRVARRTVRLFLLLTVTLLFAVTVSAYTLVMRGGRRIEIPSKFVVTSSTLTYEVSPGIQVTVALAAIDVAATERANSEQPGSLLARKQAGSPSGGPRRATLTITNRDLEPTMRRRQENEAAYERKRKQLGLPTLVEARRRAAAVPDISGSDLERQLIADRESEAYWRARASELRTEIATLDSELSYVRARLDEFPSGSFPSYSIIGGSVSPLISFGGTGLPRFSTQPGRRHNGVSVARAGSQLRARVGFGGGITRGRVVLNSGHASLRRLSGGRGHLQFPTVVGAGLIGQSYDYSFERSALITQFNELAAARAGLSARWRELENEARRAGASPGWLRP
ncbi:MAG TPA: hypothetical protein VNO50_20135 [Pyrinomonadaceae bacterium]|nr:hypothetical protein [Pyrinomonadaceae bacterium]